MARKTYYESGNCYLDVKNKRMSKKGLFIRINDEKLSRNVHFKISYETEKRFNNCDDEYVKIDTISGHKNIILSTYITGADFHNKSDIKNYLQEYSLSALRIAREYAKNNFLNLRITYDFHHLTPCVNNVVYDKEKKLTYPLMNTEIKELAKHNMKIDILMKTNELIKLPNNLNTNIDISNIEKTLSIELYDKDNAISHNFKNIEFSGKENIKLEITRKNHTINKYEIEVIEFPKDNNKYDIRLRGFYNSPVFLFKNKRPTDIIIRNTDKVLGIYKTSINKNINLQNNIIILFNKFLYDRNNISNTENNFLKELFTIMRKNNIDILQYFEDLKTLSKNNKIEEYNNKEFKINSNKVKRTRKILKNIEERNRIIDNFINNINPKNSLQLT